MAIYPIHRQRWLLIAHAFGKLHAEALLYVLKRDTFAAQCFLVRPIELLSGSGTNDEVFFDLSQRLDRFFLCSLWPRLNAG